MLSHGTYCDGCSSVGRALPSASSNPRFKSQHRQNFIYQLYLNERRKIGKKEAGNGPSQIRTYVQTNAVRRFELANLEPS